MIAGFLAKTELPKVTVLGATYFLIIIAVTWLLNTVVSRYYRGKKYTLKFSQRKGDL